MRFASSALLSLVLLLGIGSQSASADIIFGTGTSSATSNIGSYVQQTGTSATGQILGDVDDVLLALSDVGLTVPAMGAANISAAGTLFTQVVYTPIAFAWEVFELNAQNFQTTGTFTLTAVDNNGDVFVSNAFTLGNGENRVFAQAINGQDIRSLTVTASGALMQDIRQVRITQSTAIPEPSVFISSGALIALLMIVGVRQRSNRLALAANS